MSEDEVREAIESGATTREAVTRACKAGGDCGACHGMIATMIEDHVEEGALARCGASVPPGERLLPDGALVRTRAA